MNDKADTPDDPRHVAIIMDGNGRWAQHRGLPRIEGHRRGVASVRAACETATARGIQALTLYCLSSENWKRPQDELDFLMALLKQYLIEERRLIMDQALRLSTIGRRDRVPADVIEELRRTEEMSAGNDGTRLVLAIDYGGQDELLRVMRGLASRARAGDLDPAEITLEHINGNLDTCDLPDVDLLIRTGGDCRISNYLLWQISYAELYFTPTPWPEFRAEHFVEAIEDFRRRQRRFGGLGDADDDVRLA
ncbi:MAG: polyprenyl diphosphate synthase [Planctomycetota bacterium]